ncbi:uncharacterized protein [Montipora foliosa]|uniref:uncharacterized protein isoform X1 n=1 Tax=Montipora foliosa TaxID=591990 RepID=UPI0035F1E342
MSRAFAFTFGLLLTISTVSGSSDNLKISKHGQSFQYQCPINAAVGNSTNFDGLCFSILTPNKRQKFYDLLCLWPGDTKSSSDCKTPLDLDDCCQNINQTQFHKHEDGSGEFILVTKYGQISSCGNITNNYCNFTISTRAQGLLSSQVICTITSNQKAEISFANNPLFTSTTAHNKTEDVTAAVSASPPPPGTSKDDVTETVSASPPSPSASPLSPGTTTIFMMVVVVLFW